MKKAFAVLLVVVAVLGAYWIGSQRNMPPRTDTIMTSAVQKEMSYETTAPVTTQRIASVPTKTPTLTPTKAPTPRPTVRPTVRPTPAPTKRKVVSAVTKAPAKQTYIGNKNTKKFHYPSCSSVDQMKDSNKVPLSSRQEAIDKGYVPCKRCNP